VTREADVHEIVKAAQTLAAGVGFAHWGHTFEHAVMAFARYLGTVPDCTPTELTTSDIEELQHLAEGVIEVIEARLEMGRDRKSVQRDLAGAVYRIRRELEQIELWRRHYLARLS
jgi:hypothetical protein